MPVILVHNVAAVGDNPAVVKIANWREANHGSHLYYETVGWLTRSEEARGFYVAHIDRENALVCYFSDPHTAFAFKLRFG